MTAGIALVCRRLSLTRPKEEAVLKPTNTDKSNVAVAERPPAAEPEEITKITTSIFPGRYVQGAGALRSLREEVGRLGKKALAIIDRSVDKLVAPYLKSADGVTFVSNEFCGECCDPEIERMSNLARKENCTVILGIGGGKALDTAKAVGLPWESLSPSCRRSLPPMHLAAHSR
jgi:hypothetical protein